jgi:hypothetical protein
LWVPIIRSVIAIAGALCHVPYFCLHFSNTSGMDIFLNSPATFPGGPGGKRYRREGKKKRISTMTAPAWSIAIIVEEDEDMT